MSPLPWSRRRTGEVLAPGTAFLAPAGRHLTFVRDADGVVRTRLDLRPLDTPHRPAVDVLFRSAAEVLARECSAS